VWARTRRSAQLEILRRTWINTDTLWAGAFVLAGVITLFT